MTGSAWLLERHAAWRWNATVPVDASIDIFAFGCIGYLLLTSKDAIAGDPIDVCKLSLGRGNVHTHRDRAGYNLKHDGFLIDDLAIECK